MGSAVAEDAIRCKGLTKVLGGRRVVDGVDFTVRAGEVFGFLRPDGAGKTTTIRMLLGLSRPDRGEAFVLGAPIPPPPAILARVGAMVEQPAFYPWMSGRRNLAVLLQTASPSAGGQICWCWTSQPTGWTRPASASSARCCASWLTAA